MSDAPERRLDDGASVGVSAGMSAAEAGWFGRERSWIVASLGVAIILVGCGLPLLWAVSALLLNPQVRAELWITRFRAGLMARTLGYNAAVGVIALLMGLPAGFVLGRQRGWIGRVLWVILPAALILPSLAYAYGWSQFVRMIRPVAGISFDPGGPADVFRCIWSLATWLWAVPAGLIGLSLRSMETHVQQAALLDGALRRITLRQLAGPMLASAAIVTVLATQEFAVYEPTGISVVATEVRMVFDTGALSSANNSITAPVDAGGGFHSPDQAGRAAAAIATASPLLVATVLLAMLASWGASQVSASDAIGAGEWPRALDASPLTLGITLLLLALNIGLPVYALFHSLKVPFSPTRIFDEFAPQVGGAIEVAVEAAAVALIAAVAASVRSVRWLFPLALVSFLIGGQLLAIGQIRVFNRRGLFWAYNSSVVAVCTYIGRFGWLALAGARTTWTRPWRELRDVAALDGADPLAVAFQIIWPLSWRVLLAGALLVGALSLTEVPATVLLLPQDPQVLTPTLMTWVHTLRYDPMIEASLLMMAMVLIPAVIAVTLTGLSVAATRSLVGSKGAVS